jgi:hypothetical protein
MGKLDSNVKIILGVIKTVKKVNQLVNEASSVRFESESFRRFVGERWFEGE